MNNEFKHILDDDENIIATFKPNKFKFYFINLFIYSIIWSFLILIALLTYLIPDEYGATAPGWIFYIVFGALFLTLALNLLFAILSYKKRLYSYTNKRILIQSGIIGIDYKSLDHKMIGATEVTVDLFDKLLRKNTGSLKFGSQASPMSPQNLSMFTFIGIEDPYNVYKEIKKYIDSVK